jgi:hypothetical protein
MQLPAIAITGWALPVAWGRCNVFVGRVLKNCPWVADEGGGLMSQTFVVAPLGEHARVFGGLHCCLAVSHASGILSISGDADPPRSKLPNRNSDH